MSICSCSEFFNDFAYSLFAHIIKKHGYDAEKAADEGCYYKNIEYRRSYAFIVKHAVVVSKANALIEPGVDEGGNH